jgi:hypothetical protein
MKTEINMEHFKICILKYYSLKNNKSLRIQALNRSFLIHIKNIIDSHLI